MKIFHLSDLHIGLNLNNVSLLEDQEFIFNQIIDYAIENKIDAIILAGDIYDKSIPSVGAVKLLDDFLERLTKLEIKTLIIPGNHDSAERLSFGAKHFFKSHIFIAKPYAGEIEKIQLRDNKNDLNINFYLLPFIKPATVRPYFSEEIQSFEDAMKKVLSKEELNTNEKNILICHQFVTGAKTCESESVVVGNLDNIGGDCFSQFDYVALGHIHTPQNIKSNTLIRYSGTPLKYSFSEINQQKSITLLNITNQNVEISEIPLNPLRDLRRIIGKYDEVMNKNFINNQKCDDYLEIILTDEHEIPEAINRLRTVYSNVLQIKYDNSKTKDQLNLQMKKKIEHISPFELFDDFYKMRNNRNLSKYQNDLIKEIISETWR